MKWLSEIRNISELKPWDKNPRILREKPMKDLRDSIDKFGVVEPIVINKDGVIIGGHGRYYTLVEKGVEKVPCFVSSTQLSEKDFEELNIRLNKNIAGEWDWNVLANVFDVEDLTEWGFSEAELLGVDDFGDEFSLPDGDKPPFQQMTFTLADEQAEQIKIAIGDIKQTDEYKYCETMDNENSNGNALYLIVRQWAEQKK